MTNQMSNINSVEQAGKSYNKQMLITMAVAYPIFLFGAVTLIKLYPEAWWIPLIALAPMIPVFSGLSVYLRFLNRLDELQRRIQLNALAIAAGGTGLTTMTYGFLDTLADFPKLSWIWVWPILCTFWLLGGYIARRQYA